MKPTAFLRLFALLGLMGLGSLACLASGGPPAIGEVVVAKSLDANYQPVDPTSTYISSDTIYISVQVSNLVAGSVVEVKYKLDGTDYTSTTTTADKDGSGFFGFQLSATEGHTPGSYTADVYLDGVLAKTVSFTVEASGPPSLGDVVVAKGLDSSYKPTEPTSTFSPTDTIYISVRVINLVVGSKVKVIYTFNGQPTESVITAKTPGSGYDGFSFSPPAGGNPTGDYTTDVYLDDVLITTVTFTVQ